MSDPLHTEFESLYQSARHAKFDQDCTYIDDNAVQADVVIAMYEQLAEANKKLEEQQAYHSQLFRELANRMTSEELCAFVNSTRISTDELDRLLAKAKEEGRAEAQARIKVLEYALRFYAPEKVSVEHGFGISQRMDDGTIAQQALSTTSPTEVLDKVVREAEIRVLEEFGEKSGFGSSTLLQMIADRKAIRRIEP